MCIPPLPPPFFYYKTTNTYCQQMKSSVSLSPPHSLLDGANKSGIETSSERPRKTARLYKIGDANTKLSSETILLWMNNKGPTMKVRKISRHHIPKHRRSLDFNAAMNRPAYSQSRNIYTKTNIAWRRFMEYVPQHYPSSTSSSGRCTFTRITRSRKKRRRC